MKIWMRGFVDVVTKCGDGGGGGGGEERGRELHKEMPKMSILVIVKAELTLTRGRARDCGKHGF